jgi:hypothetical protein
VRRDDRRQVVGAAVDVVSKRIVLRMLTEIPHHVVKGLGDAFRVVDEPGGTVLMGGCHCRRHVSERVDLPAFRIVAGLDGAFPAGDGLGDAFRVSNEPGGAHPVFPISLRARL